MPATSDQFYSGLPANHISLSDLLVEEHLFYDVPSDWHVIVTDIRNSTQAVSNGLHETVNLIATGSIVTVLNIAYKAGITVPFFFGGDGATFIVPPSVIDVAMHALLLFKANTFTNFGLELRTGTVTVNEIYENNNELKISKFRSSDILFIPIILGGGLSFAEKIIKGDSYLFSPFSDLEVVLDLTGMQCRWDKIAPPTNGNEVVTLLVIAGSEKKQSEAYKKVIDLIDEIYGTQGKRQPISVSKLRQKTSFTRMKIELKSRLNNYWALGLFQNWYNLLLAYFYFQTQQGKSYLNRLVSMSDTLVIDGRINTVISGSRQQRSTLQAALDQLEQEGTIIYGLYVSSESVMSCYVRDLDDGHIHFVDGSNGGYTKAAGVLKQKLRTKSM
jgi:hypothetical protein